MTKPQLEAAADRQPFILGRQVGYMLAAGIASQVLALVRFGLMTSELGGSLYGIWAVLQATISLLVSFSLLGFAQSIVRFCAGQDDAGRIRDDFLSAAVIVAAVGAILGVALFAMSDSMARHLFQDAEAAKYVRMAAFLVPLDALHALPLAFFRMRRRMGLFALFMTANQLLLTGAIASSLLLGYELAGIIAAALVTSLAFNLGTFSIIIKKMRLSTPSFRNIGAYLRWGIPLTPTQAVLWILSSSDKYMVSYLLGVSSAGLYAAGYSLGQYAGFLTNPVQMVLFPYLVTLHTGGQHEAVSRYLKYSTRYLMIVAIPAVFGLSILGAPLLELLSSPEFAPASALLPYVAASMLPFGCYALTASVPMLINKTHINLALLGIAATLNIALNLVFIPRMGITGAAAATLIAYTALWLLGLRVARAHLAFDISLPSFFKSVLAAAIMAIAISLMHPHGLTMLLTSIALGTLVYSTVLILIRGLSKSELRFLIAFARGSVGKMRATR